MTHTPAPVNRLRLEAETRDFFDWAEGHRADLRALISDHEFLLSNERNRILFLVDFYDVLKSAFPLADVNPRKVFADREQLDEVLRGQLARSCFFFNLPTRKNNSYYPILLPSPYLGEMFSCFASAKSLKYSVPPFDSILTDIRDQLSQQYGSDPIAALSKLPPEESLKALIELSPELFFYISGHITLGLGIIEKMLGKSPRVTTDFSEWPLTESQRELVWDGTAFRGFDPKDANEIAKWHRVFQETAEKRKYPKFYSAWMADIQALRLVSFLNKGLADAGVRALLVSSAPIMESVMSHPDASALACIGSPPEVGVGSRTSLFRRMDIFRLYLRYCNWRTDTASPQTIIAEATNDLRKVEQFLEAAPRNVIESGISTGASESTVELAKMRAQMKNVNDLRDDLQRCHHSAGARMFIDHYRQVNIDILDRKQLMRKGDGGQALYATFVTSLLQPIRDRLDEIVELIFRVKIYMVNEYFGWVNVSQLAQLEDAERRLGQELRDFIMFPFLVRFRTHELCKAIAELAELLRTVSDSSTQEPLPQPREQFIRSFYAILKLLADGCSAATETTTNFWNERIDPAGRTPNAMERRLAWLVLLFAFGYAKEVEEDAVRLLQIADIPFRADFRVMAVQAGLRRVLRDHSKDGPEHIRLVVTTIERALRWYDDDKDVRLLHLAVFAAGTRARRGWLSGHGYGRAWVLEEAERVVEVLEEERRKTPNDGDILLLKRTCLSNWAYYLAVDGTKDDVREAVRKLKLPEMEGGLVTGLCMHNRAYVYLCGIRNAETSEEAEGLYVAAQECFSEAKRRLFAFREGRRLEEDRAAAANEIRRWRAGTG